MILVTGGAGYIGTHTCIALNQIGKQFIILDNFINTSPNAIERLTRVLGFKPRCITGDARDETLLHHIFQDYPITAAIHFAAYKYMGESIVKPLEYYDNNLASLLALLKAMRKVQVHQLIFSSSCGVYGNVKTTPIKESSPKHALTPYGWTKIMCEQIIEDLITSEEHWSIAQLRYFNPIGAHESGLIGEEAKGTPNMLLPYLLKVANKELPYLQIMGGDYPTVDGTPVRDYLHVMDLAEGHCMALQKVEEQRKGLLTVNLGSGKGYSVLQMVKAFEEVTGVQVPYKIVDRRKGDAAQAWADTQAAKELLGWEAKRSLKQMLTDSWRWQKTLSNSQNEGVQKTVSVEAIWR